MKRLEGEKLNLCTTIYTLKEKVRIQRNSKVERRHSYLFCERKGKKNLFLERPCNTPSRK